MKRVSPLAAFLLFAAFVLTPTPARSADGRWRTNFLVSKARLDTGGVLARLGWPVEVTLVPLGSLAAPIHKVPAVAYVPAPGHSLTRDLVGAAVTRKKGEPVLDFARRVAVAVRARATIGYSYTRSPAEDAVHRVFGSPPLLCSDMALAFRGVMELNGVWVNTLGLFARDNDWDRHSTTEIYSPELARWMVVDATFAGVFRGPDGDYLDAAGVQRHGAGARFEPFEPGKKWHRYHIEPLGTLFSGVQYEGRRLDRYEEVAKSPRSPYKFRVEALETAGRHLYMWRTGEVMALRDSASGEEALPAGAPVLAVSAPASRPSVEKAAWGEGTSVALERESNPGEAFFKVKALKGGLRFDAALEKGRMYVVDAIVKPLGGDGRKLLFSFQDGNVRQWATLEGDEWNHIRYLVVSDGTPAAIYLYNDVPVVFALRSLEVRPVDLPAGVAPKSGL